MAGCERIEGTCACVRERERAREEEGREREVVERQADFTRVAALSVLP